MPGPVASSGPTDNLGEGRLRPSPVADPDVEDVESPATEPAGGRRTAIARASPPGRSGQDVASGGASSDVEARRPPVFDPRSAARISHIS